MSAIEIPLEEVEFHPLSFADPSGRLFWWRKELYRGIPQEKADLYERMFRDGIAQKLVEKQLLVETELTTLALDGFGLILKHRPVVFVSYPYEWCPLMLKDAGLMVIELEIELTKEGLTLQDAHPWNVLFDGCRPIYVDFGSIVSARTDSSWPTYDEFCRFFLYPLILMTHGQRRLAAWLLHDDQGVLKTDLDALVPGFQLSHDAGRVTRWTFSLAKRLIPPALRPPIKNALMYLKSTLAGGPDGRTPASKLDFLQWVRRELEDLTLPSPKTEWSEYYDGQFPAFLPSHDWTAKHHSVYKTLTELKPGSVLDIGSNRGWYSQLAARLGSKVVAFDVDAQCTAELYADAKRKDLPILPLVMDFRNPSRGYGLTAQWRNQSLVSAMQRLKCDMVIALALVHHLVFKQNLNFEQIVEGLSAFANRWLMVEFVPREDQYVREWWSEHHSWYTLDNFLAAARRQFRRVEVRASDPSPRVLVWCEK